MLNWRGLLCPQGHSSWFCPKDFRFSCSNGFAGRGGLPSCCLPVPIIFWMFLSSEAQGAWLCHLPLLSLWSWCPHVPLQGCRSERAFSLSPGPLCTEGGRWRHGSIFIHSSSWSRRGVSVFPVESTRARTATCLVLPSQEPFSNSSKMT